MNENISKPITIVRAEFISNLTDLINKSGLPPFIIEPILKDVYLEIRDAAQKQYEFDVQKYKQQLKEKSKNTNQGNDEGDLVG